VTPTERADLAERLLPVASKLACIVHGDGNQHDIAHHTRRLNREELIGLTVVLAAMVNPDERLEDALGYVTWDEHGRPAPAIVYGNTTIRSLSSHLIGPETLGAAPVLESERIQRAREIHLQQGYSYKETAAMVGCDPRTVQRWASEGWAA
jgi:hypothetical protein